MESLQQYWTRLRTAWGGLSAFHRFLVYALVAVVLATTISITYYTVSTDYQPLFTGLPPEESALITAQLDSANIPYRLNNSGSTILVPKDMLAKARIETAARGTQARSGKGFELFDDVSIGMTPFVQNVNYTRALQSELARTIMQLEPVASARVMIARPDPSPFARDQQPATASVALKLKPGANINRSTAAGIISLVSRSVEGLKPENVTVVDSNGRMLSDGHGSGQDSLSSSELEHRRELENYLSNKAEEMLARHLGSGRAIVRISADLNLEKVKETQEKYAPEERAVRSEQTTSSETGSGSEARGIAGAGSNLSRPVGPVSNPGSTQRTKEETTHTDYAVSKTVRELEHHLGDLQRLTVATMVDLTPPESGTAQTMISLKEVEEIVKQAVGFQSGRDEIKVTNVTLATTVPMPIGKDESNWPEQVQSYVRLARNLAVAVGIVFLGATILLVIRRLARMPVTEKPNKVEMPATNRQLVETNNRMLSPEQSRFLDMALQQPQQVAQVLSVFLNRNGKI
jgi:flagellar M-ring protein FliF